MTAEATAPPAPAIRRPALDRATAMRLAATEYGRYTDQLRALATRDWSRRTVCQDWNVRDMAGHCLGMAEFASSIRNGMRQYLAALRRFERDGGNPTDHLNALQVDEHRHLEPRSSCAATRPSRRGPRAAGAAGPRCCGAGRWVWWSCRAVTGSAGCSGS